MKYVLVMIATLVLAGCTTPMTAYYVDPAINFGPKPANPEATAKRYFGPALKDANTALYQVTDPMQCIVTDALPDFAIPPLYGWCYEVQINARNSFGAYTGWKSYSLFVGGVNSNLVVDRDVLWQRDKQLRIIGRQVAECVGGGIVDERC